MATVATLSTGDIVRGKLHAARTLGMMTRHLRNWRDVWSAYRSSRTLPTLAFRSGFVLHHRPQDDPIMLMHEVFGGRHYRRHVPGRADGAIVDIGANIGMVSLDWATRSPGVVLHAYEPNPDTAETLRRNVHDSGCDARVCVHQEAVGAGFGQTPMWIGGPSVLSSTHSASQAGTREVMVSMVDLDRVCDRVDGRVFLLKIDAEGAEADILEAASARTLERVAHIALEYHDPLTPGALQRCRTRLTGAGFELIVRPAPDEPRQGMLYAIRR